MRLVLFKRTSLACFTSTGKMLREECIFNYCTCTSKCGLGAAAPASAGSLLEVKHTRTKPKRGLRVGGGDGWSGGIWWREMETTVLEQQ